ncbi:MAG: Bacteriohemerythrin [Turneriella sp.]|nr:Bacteriohemerythrin [Turneriella sp.]
MSEFEWSDSYSTGIKEIDEQHIYLFGLVNRVIRAANAEESKKQISQIIEELIDYTVYHFGFEESIMQKVGFSLFDEHKKKHDTLKNQVLLYAAEIKAGGLEIPDFVEFMKSWLKLHILREDMKYIPALSSKERTSNKK